ncbi:hypothetical protein BO94DRAFT_266701 [Aspergillus sclerotioniger CBS 115572]|uniref:Uncharacterized protein n=1 Tax=Aspergillus sclerotioniger CBS 115572 TaxID=1450535 RepID=A0A317VD58_9EURO|nr:hypothetical protein BO94DRAFT_266701 [Aspergillus sclerotioniger CBS 115572]PWY70822.1 hypothetical protein BO94DRAFT_266701 [Aspergillus sclerotioniger CBS 115572]
MSTEPLLPSYASATQHRYQSFRRRSAIVIPAVPPDPAVPVIQTLSALTFTGTTIVSTAWAYRSYAPPDLSPPVSAPLLPYFASLCLTISLSFWVGYLIFILYDEAGGPTMQRKIVVGVSAVGKLVLAGAHIGVWLGYKYLGLGPRQPNWGLMFLAAQAWWDLLLFVVYSCLRAKEEPRTRR